MYSTDRRRAAASAFASAVALMLLAGACGMSSETAEESAAVEVSGAETLIEPAAEAAPVATTVLPTPIPESAFVESPDTNDASEEVLPATPLPQPTPTTPSVPTVTPVPAPTETPAPPAGVTISLPSVDVVDLHTGATQNLAEYSTSGPLLMWFWAPH